MPTSRNSEFSHPLLVARNRAEVHRLYRILRKLMKRDKLITTIVLAHDEHCCVIEEWPKTRELLLARLRERM